MASLKTGTYTGTGATLTQKVPLDFVPDMIIVAGAGDYPCFRTNTCWHGRTQFFGDLSSAPALGSFWGKLHEPFHGEGFAVTGVANTLGTVYHYFAIRDNQTNFLQHTSWIGNATAGRTLDWTAAQPSAVFVKRDASGLKPSIWRWDGASTSLRGDYQGGTGTYITSLSAGGIVVDGSVQTNENNNLGRGEGIEGVAFLADANYELLTWTGDGALNRTISAGFQPTFAIILDAINDATATTMPHCFVSQTMPSGTLKEFGNTSLISGRVSGFSSAGLVLSDASYNATGRTYVALVFCDNAEASVEDTHVINDRTPVTFRNAVGYGDIVNEPDLVGACSLEWYGIPRYNYHDPVYLMMFGAGDAGTKATSEGEYNGGLYLYNTDPDAHGWSGLVCRIIQHDYYSPTRDEGSINYYNINTGVVFQAGKPVHLVCTHDGSGHWRLYANGKIVKDNNLNLDTAIYGYRSNGGTGTAKPAIINTRYDIPTTPVAEGMTNTTHAVVSIWGGVELSSAHARNRYNAIALNTETYTGPTPSKEYNFIETGLATDATLTSTVDMDPGWVESGDQFFTDFSATTPGLLPPDTILKRGSVSGDYQCIDTDGQSLRYLAPNGGSIARGLAYTNMVSAGEVDVYLEFNDINDSSPASGRVVVFASDAPDNEYGCYVDVFNNAKTVYRRVAGVFTSIVSLSDTSLVAGRPYKLRFTVTPGSPNILKMRCWEYYDAEPTTWDINTTNSNLTLSTGWIGHIGFAEDKEVVYQAIGIGLNGDAAPSGITGTPYSITQDLSTTVTTTQTTLQDLALSVLPAAFVYDTFTDTVSGAITGHTGEVGASYTRHPSYTVAPYLDAATGQIFQSTTAQAVAFCSGVPASPNYKVSGGLTLLSILANNSLGVVGRVQPTATMYFARWLDATTGWQLYKIVAGVTTLKGSSTTPSFSAGQSKTLTLVMDDDQISVEVDGTTIIGPVTDTAIPDAGYAGVRGSSSVASTATTGMHMDWVQAEDLVTSGISYTITQDLVAAIATSLSNRQDLSTTVATQFVTGQDLATEVSTEQAVSQDLALIVATQLATAQDLMLTVSELVSYVVRQDLELQVSTQMQTAHDLAAAVSSSLTTLANLAVQVATGQTLTQDVAVRIATEISTLQETLLEISGIIGYVVRQDLSLSVSSDLTTEQDLLLQVLELVDLVARYSLDFPGRRKELDFPGRNTMLP